MGVFYPKGCYIDKWVLFDEKEKKMKSISIKHFNSTALVTIDCVRIDNALIFLRYVRWTLSNNWHLNEKKIGNTFHDYFQFNYDKFTAKS